MKIWLFVGLLTCFGTAAASESMGAGQQGSNITTPRHGQNMEAVRQQFGQPSQQLPAVGEPPITRWVYNGFTVYFEHDIVIHSVKHRS
ncbi:MAG: hypothetical protein HWE27_17015 [Gammaproteobacteria bacterium]|nr:hypothetical protein [Gammaproteobacteria bacterium]